MTKVVVVGSLNMDLVVQVPHFPIPGETLLGGEYNQHPGGKGANQAVAAARAGGNVTMIGRVGQDGFGEVLKKQLEADGINTTQLEALADSPTGVAFITVDNSAQNCIIVSSGANMKLMPDDLPADVIQAADVLVLQLEVPLQTVFHAAQLAQQAGTKVILNLAPAQALKPEQVRHVDVLVVNESEAALLAGEDVANVSLNPETTAKALAEQVPTVILTLGAAGVVWCHDKTVHRFPSFKVEAVDTTAAGDAFVGALAASYDDTTSLAEAVRVASATGALAVTRAGAQPSLPSRKEIDAFLAEQPQ
ncbi:MAG: ribokinase [Deinococcota bacterium]